MPNTQPDRSVSRRSTLTGLGAAGAALTATGLGGILATGGQVASAAQSGSKDYSDHPLSGVWLAMANPQVPGDPQIAVPSVFASDGSVVLSFPLSQHGANGVVFTSPFGGTWEPYDAQTGHFTAVQTVTDIEGTVLAVVTVDGHPKVNADGMTFEDDGQLNTVTIRDATGAVVAVIPPGTPVDRSVTATRMSPGVSGFPDDQGTPEASPTI